MLQRFGFLAAGLAACLMVYSPAPAPAQEEAPPEAEAPHPGPAPKELWDYARTPTPSNEAVAKMLIVWAETDVDSGEAPLTVKFSCEPLEDGVKSPSYEWDFGDGSPKVKGEAPSHTYTKPGTYTAR